MSRWKRPRLVILPAALLVLACSPGQPMATAPAASPAAAVPAGGPVPAAAASTGAASARPSPTAVPSAVPSGGGGNGLVAQALAGATPLAGAAVKVFRLGQGVAIAAGKSGTNGAFLVDLGTSVPRGTPVQLVASLGGKTVSAIGVAGVVSTNSGNIVAQGGGNIVAQGGGNYHIAAAAASPGARPDVVTLDLAATLTVALLGPRFRAAGQAATGADGALVSAGLPDLLLAYDRLDQAAATTVAALGSSGDTTSLLGTLDATGQGSLPADLASHLSTVNPGLVTAFASAAINLSSSVEEGTANGGTPPGADATAPVALGGATAPAANASSSSGSVDGEQGARGNPNDASVGTVSTRAQ